MHGFLNHILGIQKLGSSARLCGPHWAPQWELNNFPLKIGASALQTVEQNRQFSAQYTSTFCNQGQVHRKQNTNYSSVLRCCLKLTLQTQHFVLFQSPSYLAAAKWKKGLRADTLHSCKNSTFFPLQLLNVKHNQQQREECFTHWATMWHLQNLSIHQMVHSVVLHLLRLEGKIFLCYCSVQLLEPGKGNAWDPQKLACQQLCWRKYPDPRQFSRGSFLNSSTPSNSLEPGTQMAPTNHLRLIICQYMQDHKKKCYFSDSTPKSNWERWGQQRKHFKFKKLTALSTFLFFEHSNKQVYMERSMWCSYEPDNLFMESFN